VHEGHRAAHSAPVSPVATFQPTVPAFSRYESSQPGCHKGLTAVGTDPDRSSYSGECAWIRGICPTGGAQHASFCQATDVAATMPRAGELWSVPQSLDHCGHPLQATNMLRQWDAYAAHSVNTGKPLEGAVAPCTSQGAPGRQTAAANAAWPQLLLDAQPHIDKAVHTVQQKSAYSCHNTSPVRPMQTREHVPQANALVSRVSSYPGAPSTSPQRSQPAPSLLTELAAHEPGAFDSIQQPRLTGSGEQGYASREAMGRFAVQSDTENHAGHMLTQNMPSLSVDKSGDSHSQSVEECDATLSHAQLRNSVTSPQAVGMRSKSQASCSSHEHHASARTSWAPNFLAATESSRARAHSSVRHATISAPGGASRSFDGQGRLVKQPRRPSALARMRRLESEPQGAVGGSFEQLQKKVPPTRRSRRSIASVTTGIGSNSSSSAARGPFPQVPAQVCSQMHMQGHVHNVKVKWEQEVQHLQQSLGELDLRHDELLRDVSGAPISERCVSLICWKVIEHDLAAPYFAV
jgi:hypothetical protein